MGQKQTSPSSRFCGSDSCCGSAGELETRVQERHLFIADDEVNAHIGDDNKSQSSAPKTAPGIAECDAPVMKAPTPRTDAGNGEAVSEPLKASLGNGIVVMNDEVQESLGAAKDESLLDAGNAVLDKVESPAATAAEADAGEPSNAKDKAEEEDLSFKSSVVNETEEHVQASGSGRTSRRPSVGSGKPIGTPFPKRPMFCRLGKATWEKLAELFSKMDIDGCNVVTREKAADFFKGTFGKISGEAMFNEVDRDSSGAITAQEFINFWLQVRSSGYSDKDILDELGELIEGGAWVDWKDGRDTAVSRVSFPKRPVFCNLSSKLWKKCQELFNAIDKDGKMAINPENAVDFFKGNFANVSVDAMFKETDLQNHGNITAEEWMKFWKQVKSSGYKEKAILEELEMLMEGGAWVDWKDGRSTS